jgi:hypothetical protein
MSGNDDARLASILVSLPYGRIKTLAELLDGWRLHMVRFQDESRASATMNPYMWGAHDYVAALNLRSLVSRGTEQASNEIQQKVSLLVGLSDEILTSFTEPDVNGLMERFTGEHHTESEWWWRRIPISGPVRDEIRQVAEG